jgi:RecJ-like exonuclease
MIAVGGTDSVFHFAGRPNGSEPRPGDAAPKGTQGTGEAICPRCSGEGTIDGRTCDNCNGTGKVVEGIGGG